jgi:hypothetical protein
VLVDMLSQGRRPGCARRDQARGPARRLTLILPPVQPDRSPRVEPCPDPGGGGRHLQQWQTVRKPLRDTQLREVNAQRDRCGRGGRPFRVYPAGVSHDQTRARLTGVAVLVSVLGLSYGAVARALAALGCLFSTVAVSSAVPAAGMAVAGRRGPASRPGRA